MRRHHATENISLERKGKKTVLHGNRESRLEGGEIGTGDTSAGHHCDLWRNLTHQTSRNGTRHVGLGLDGSNVRLVGTAHRQNVTEFVRFVGRHTGEFDLIVHFVDHSNVEGAEFAGCQAGKQGSLSVTGAKGETRHASSANTVLGVATNLETLGGVASRERHVGQFQDIQTGGSIEATLLEIEAEIGSLGGFETDRKFRVEFERCFENSLTVCFDLGLVHVEFGVAKLGSNFGRDATA